MAAKFICSIANCNKTVTARGWCSAHYWRWRKHGDPLGGRTTEGEPERYLREVVLAYEGDDCLPWPYANSGGYGYVNLASECGGRVRVTRFVCEHDKGPPPTPEHEAAHSCGNGHKRCCTKRHLSWKTSKGNKADMVAHGTRLQGERVGNSKLTESDVRQIRALNGRMSLAEIGKTFGVGAPHICRIYKGEKWAHLD